MLSIIVPTFNELKNHIIQRSFPLLSKLKDCEIIIVDSHSTDGTVELAKKYGFSIIQTKSNSRAVRLNLGIKNSTHDMVLLHHPRSILTLEGIHFLKTTGKLKWGGFTHCFDYNSSLLLKFTSFYSNYIRTRRGILYLDHCIFAKKEMLLSVGLIPEVDIFEDTEISLKLRNICAPSLLPYPSLTSATRFKQNGIWKQALINQVLKWKYYFKFNHKNMNKEYEKGLDLNSDYKDLNE